MGLIRIKKENQTFHYELFKGNKTLCKTALNYKLNA